MQARSCLLALLSAALCLIGLQALSADDSANVPRNVPPADNVVADSDAADSDAAETAALETAALETAALETAAPEEAANPELADAPRSDPTATEPAAEERRPANQREQANGFVDRQRPGVPPRQERYQRPIVLPIEGTITPLTEMSLRQRIEQAREHGPDLLIIEIDSPGGYLEQSQNIAAMLRSIDWARTVAYVPDKALSGAAMLSLGCDDIVMGPGARFGDIGVLYYDGDAFRYAPEKQISDTVTYIRHLAEAKGRSPALAEAMVDMEIEVFQVRRGEGDPDQYLTAAELEIQGRDNFEFVQAVFEARESRFLDVTGARAVELGIAQAVAENPEQLRDLYGWEGESLRIEGTWIETLAFVLQQPLIVGLLIIFGLVGLYFEFTSPGTAFGGVTAVICFGLFFWSHYLGGTAGMLEVGLFVVGGLLLAVELFVLPGFGIAGFSGLVLMVAGLLMAGQNFVVPQTAEQLVVLRNSLLTLFCSGLAFLAIAWLFRGRMENARLFRGIVLATDPSSDPEVLRAERARRRKQSDLPTAPASAPPPAVETPQVGDVGLVTAALRPAGKMRWQGRHWDVVHADGDFVPEGAAVEVAAIRSGRLQVRVKV